MSEFVTKDVLQFFIGVVDTIESNDWVLGFGVEGAGRAQCTNPNQLDLTLLVCTAGKIQPPFVVCKNVIQNCADARGALQMVFFMNQAAGKALVFVIWSLACKCDEQQEKCADSEPIVCVRR